MAHQPAAHAGFDPSAVDPSAAVLAAESAGAVRLDAVDSLTFVPVSLGFDAVKRGFDIVVGLLLATMLLPLMVIVALAVAVAPGGSVLVTEWRIGRGGRPFAALRFRTQPENGSRRSALGRLLYRTRLDELPQIVNVLAGDIGIVGPHAATPEEASRLAAVFPGYELRHMVRPGLTGWSQTMGEWSEGDAGRRLGFDLYYVRHCGPWLDLRIVLRTVLLMALGRTGR